MGFKKYAYDISAAPRFITSCNLFGDIKDSFEILRCFRIPSVIRASPFLFLSQHTPLYWQWMR
jgi:hypothetical protein